MEEQQPWGWCSSAVEVLLVASSRRLAGEFLSSPSTESLAEMLLPRDTPLSSRLPGPCGVCPACSLLSSRLGSPLGQPTASLAGEAC